MSVVWGWRAELEERASVLGGTAQGSYFQLVFQFLKRR